MSPASLIGLLVLAAPPPEGAPPGADPKAPAAEPPATAASQGKQAALDLVGRWLQAQNAGDFAAYQALYAPRFTGVRRSGPRTVKLDRAGWMKDRGRMFDKKMTVAADDVEVALAATTTSVRFRQRFKLGGYQDAGPKLVVLVLEGGRLAIAREEMLASRPGGARPARDASALDRFAFMMGGEIVLDASPPGGWGSGPPRLESDDNPVAVRRAVDVGRLPADVRRAIGGKVKVYGPDGVCETTIGSPSLLGRAHLHFSTAKAWREADATDAFKAADAFQQTQSGTALVAGLDGRCRGWFARSAALPDPPVEPARWADPIPRAQALRAFRKLGAWKDVQKSFESDGGGKKGAPWDETDGKPSIFELFATVAGKPVKLVSVTAEAGVGCGGFGGSLWVLFEVDGGKYTRRDGGDGVAYPAAAVDVDGDGTSEILFRRGAADADADLDGILWRAKDAWDRADEIAIPDYDCPC